MLNWLLEQYLKVSLETRRLAHFLFLILSLTTSQALFALLSRSLFLDRVGAASLPLLFTVTPVVLIVVSTGFLGLIDRISHIRLFRWILFVGILLVGGIQVLIAHQSTVIPYYGLYILSNILSVLLIKISFSTLVSDYFTALGLKRYTAVLFLGANIGFLLANSLGSVIVQFISPENLLLSIPLLYAIAITQLVYLERDQEAIEINPPTAKTSPQGLVDSLKKFPRLAKQYPIIFYLAIGTFIILLLRLLTEFLFSTVYAERFPKQQDLTSFLGLSSAMFSLIQLLLTSLVTTPLIQRLGVSRANLIYPLTTLLGFIGLAVNFGLPTAVFANVNHVAIYRSIADPLKTINYNAVPAQALGTFRVLSEGLFSPVGEMIGGLILLALMSSGTSLQVSILGIILSLVLVGVSFKTGKSYRRSLVKMLVSGSVNLDQVRQGLTLNTDYQSEVQNLLESGDRTDQILGLELAIYLQPVQQFLPQVNALLSQADRQLRQAIVSFLRHLPEPIISYWVRDGLNSKNTQKKAVALEILIDKNQFISETKLASLLTEEPEEIRALTCVAIAAHQQSLHPKMQKTCQQLWEMKLDCPIAQATIDVISHTKKRELLPILCQILPLASCEIKQQGLKALVGLASRNDRGLREVAALELANPNPEVRAEAVKLLGAIADPQMLNDVLTCLQDVDYRVRSQAAKAISVYGEMGLSSVEKCLSSERPEVVKTAITAMGYIGTYRAEDILFNHVSEELQQVYRTGKWQQIPREHPSWKLLAIAIEDFHLRVIERVFYVLSCLGCKHTLEALRVLRYSTDKRIRANAVETIAALRYRRFILPILPLLEQWADGGNSQPEIALDAEWMNSKGYKLLLEALESKERWIEMGAIMALATVPFLVIQTSDVLVQEFVQQVFPPTSPIFAQDYFMNRILILKNISLFQGMSLDELLILTQELVEEEFMPNEVIIQEGSIGTHLYILIAGTVVLTKSIRGTQQTIKQLSPGECFGEYQLFADSPSTVGAIAVTDCQLLKLEKNSLLSLTDQRPGILLEICKQLSRIIEELLNDVNLREQESLPPG
ncbi:MAG: cyclic nucleotide-binding domain-containing protein [Lyngbya sp.]|nr:cyclic nucleotide-binding domain-containing protein [Lyngbya sp.]